MGITTPFTLVIGVSLLGWFIIGCFSLVIIQYVGSKILDRYPTQKQHLMDLTKTYFIQLMTFYHANISPIKMSITFDTKKLPVDDNFKVDYRGNLKTVLSPNAIFISNHQIYTDWLYVWFLLYTAKLSSTIHIILKDLSKVPILGYGMKNFNFMFLSRKWEKDKVVLTNQLLEIDANARGSGPANGVVYSQSANITNGIGDIIIWPDQKISKNDFPYTVVIYPEGTVPSDRTIKKSREFCEKVGRPRLNHILLPRVRGLYLLLTKLKKSVEVVYDITTGYSGLKENDKGEDIYTLKNVFLLGKGPKQINYHIKSYNIKDIPLGDEVLDVDQVNAEDLKKFEDWLFQVWYEKDELMDNFYKYGKFILSDDPDFESYKTVVADMKLRNLLELSPILSVALIGIYIIVKIFAYIFNLIF